MVNAAALRFACIENSRSRAIDKIVNVSTSVATTASSREKPRACLTAYQTHLDSFATDAPPGARTRKV